MRKLIVLSLLFAATGLIVAQEVPEPPAPVFREFHEGKFLEAEMKKNESHYLKQLSKELSAELKSIKSLDEEQYFELLRDSYYSSLGHMYFENEEEKKIMELETKINELEMRSEILGIRYTKDKKANKKKIEDELLVILNSLFDSKEAQRKDNIKRIVLELEELKKSINVRKNHKDEIVKQRLRELLDQDEYLDWD